MFLFASGDFHPAWVLFPLVCCFVSYHVTAFFFKRKKASLETWLRKSNQAHRDTWLVATVIQVGIFSILISGANFPVVFYGKLTSVSFVCLTLLPFTLGLIVFTHLLGHYSIQHQREIFEEQMKRTLVAERDIAIAESCTTATINLVMSKKRRFLTSLFESQGDKIETLSSQLGSRRKDLSETSGTTAIKPREFLKLWSPNPLAAAIVVAVAQQAFSKLNIPNPDGRKNRIRATLFRRGRTHLDFIASFDGTRENVVDTPKSQKDKFELTNAAGCLAVAAAGKSEPVIVPNTKKSAHEPSCSYWHFTSKQQATIKSIVAIPIFVPGDTNALSKYVLCVDGDREDYFIGDIRQECDFIRRFALQILEFARVVDDSYQGLFEYLKEPKDE